MTTSACRTPSLRDLLPEVIRFCIFPLLDDLTKILFANAMYNIPLPGVLSKEVVKSAGRYNSAVVRYLLKSNLLDDFDVCSFAAFYGNIPLLEWARSTGFHWCPNGSTCYMAVEGRQLETLKWMRSVHVPAPFSESCTRMAAYFQYYDLLIWLVENGCPSDGDTMRTYHLVTSSAK